MDEVEELIKELKGEDGKIRRSAAKRLGEIKDERAVPALIERLKDENEGVRVNAAWALGNIGDASAVPALIKASKNGSKNVRRCAASALGNIGDASAVSILMELLFRDKEWVVREYAGWALGAIGKPAIPELLEALKDKHYPVQVRAADALEKVVKKFSTMEELEEIEKGISDYSTELREGHPDKTTLINAQIEIASVTREIAQKKDELAPRRDLLLDDKPKPPKRGRGVYQTVRRATSR